MQQELTLICHPDTPSPAGTRVYAFVNTFADASDRWSVEFHVHSERPVKLPEAVPSARTDGLWRTTCFEVFVMPHGSSEYLEFNLSPSFAWAAYRFDGYRAGGRDLPLIFAPEIELPGPSGDWFAVYAELDVSVIGQRHAALGLSAVIEETDGTKSYWALAHPPGPPDFHHPDCFAAVLPPPPGA